MDIQPASYSVTFQWRHTDTAIVRLHPGEGAKYGDPYVWWTVLAVHDEGLIELLGADRPVPSGGMQAIREALRLAGYRRRFH